MQKATCQHTHKHTSQYIEYIKISSPFQIRTLTCEATMASLILPMAVDVPVPTTTALQRPDVT
jgi:hypothetical protein